MLVLLVLCLKQLELVVQTPELTRGEADFVLKLTQFKLVPFRLQKGTEMQLEAEVTSTLF